MRSKSPEALPYKGFEFAELSVESSNKPINAIPIKLAIAYWTKETLAGNHEAAHLLAASADEAIQRRADSVFGISRTEIEYNRAFEKTFKQLELFPEGFEYLQQYSENSELYNDEEYKIIRPLLKNDYKNPVFGMTEDEFRDDLASLSARTEMDVKN